MEKCEICKSVPVMLFLLFPVYTFPTACLRCYCVGFVREMEQYEEVKKIGRGNFGTAHLVRDRLTDEEFVIKKIPIGDLDVAEREQALKEVKLQQDLRHQNIVLVFYSGNTLLTHST